MMKFIDECLYKELFHFGGYVEKQNCRVCSTENSHVNHNELLFGVGFKVMALSAHFYSK